MTDLPPQQPLAPAPPPPVAQVVDPAVAAQAATQPVIPTVQAAGRKQFVTTRRPDIEFEVDGEVFVATGTAPADVLMGLREISKGEGSASLDVIHRFFGMVFDEDNLTRFMGRMRDRTRPITFQTAMEVFGWLVSEYSGRPTELSSGSPAGQPATGTTSTASAPSVVSTPAPSPSTAT